MKYQTSGDIVYSKVKGLLHLDEPWWIDIGVKGRAFQLVSYAGFAATTHLTEGGRLNVAPGYLWDGTSRPLVTAQGKVDVAPSLFHDVFEEAWRARKITRAELEIGDRIYREMLIDRDMTKVRAYNRWFWLRVRRFFRLDGQNEGPEYPKRRAA